MAAEVSPEALALHQRSLVIDNLIADPSSEDTLDNLRAGGVRAGNWTVAGHSDSFEGTLMKMEERRWMFAKFPDKGVVALSAADIEPAARENRFAAFFGIQGADMLENKFHRLAILWRLGLRILQPTYNERNNLGDGCLERENRGLTNFGVQILRDCNRLGILFDVAHAGVRTALDAAEISTDPITYSHGGVYSVRENPRNVRDEVMKSIAAKGGVIGIALFSDFVGDTSEGRTPTVEDYVRHVDYAVNLVGVDHICVGSDLMGPGEGFWWDNNTFRRYPEICGGMTSDRHQCEGFPNHSAIPKITDALMRRGYPEADIQKIMGLNLLRLYRQVLRGEGGAEASVGRPAGVAEGRAGLGQAA